MGANPSGDRKRLRDKRRKRYEQRLQIGAFAPKPEQPPKPQAAESPAPTAEQTGEDATKA